MRDPDDQSLPDQSTKVICRLPRGVRIGRTYLLRTTLQEVEQTLNPLQFAPIHRTAIVNIDHVSEILDAQHGDFVIVLDTGVKLRLSRNYRKHLFSRIYSR
jgi:two-component system LytT family response regulator